MRARARTDAADDRGSVVVLVAVALVLAAAVGVGAARVGAAVAARAEAQTAADAAALAAADMLALGRGSEAAVSAARETARANGSRLVKCTCTGRVVEVVVARSVSIASVAKMPLEARARAEIRPIWPLFAR